MSFSYTGPSVAAAFVAGVFNDAQERAADAASDADTEFGAARGTVAVTPDALAAGLTTVPTITEADIDLSQLLDRQAEISAAADDRATLFSDLVSELESFMASYFPGVDAAVRAARDALVALLQGSNFADGRDVSRQRIGQAEEKITRDAMERDDVLINQFAARGFPVPPGELMHRLARQRIADTDTLADQAIEIDQAEAAREKEALERTLRLLVDNRSRALQAFAAYLAAACAARYDRGVKQTEASHRATQLMTDLLADQLATTNRAAALQIKAGEVDHGLDRQYLASLDKLGEQQANAQLQAALALARMLGTQAATAYNAFRASASVGSAEEMNDI